MVRSQPSRVCSHRESDTIHTDSEERKRQNQLSLEAWGTTTSVRILSDRHDEWAGACRLSDWWWKKHSQHIFLLIGPLQRVRRSAFVGEGGGKQG